MYCTGCGSEIAPDAAFCTKCGAKVAAAPQPEAPATAETAPLAAATAPLPVARIAADDAPAPQLAAPVVTVGDSSPSRAGRVRWGLVLALGLVLLAAGGFAAVRLGLADALLTEEAVSSSAAGDADSDDSADESARDAEAEEAKSDGSDGGALPEGHPDIGEAPLGAADSYALLAEHYGKLWDLHESIGVQDKDAYTGTGFVFEDGGFNASIGHSDKAVREKLVDRCKDLVDEVSSAKAELEGKVVDSTYDSQKAALLGLYDALTMRVEAMYDAAAVAVDKPARDDGWGDKLQPRSQDGRKRFEADYPDAEPSEL